MQQGSCALSDVTAFLALGHGMLGEVFGRVGCFVGWGWVFWLAVVILAGRSRLIV